MCASVDGGAPKLTYTRRDGWLRLHGQLATLESTLPEGFARRAGSKLVFSDTFLRVAHANRLAARIILYEVITTASSSCAALAECVQAATQLLEFVTSWHDAAVLKDILAILLPTWAPAVRTFARQAALLQRERRRDAARQPLATLSHIESSLLTFSSTLVAAAAERILSTHRPFFECDWSTCMPACSAQEVEALMNSSLE